MRDISRRKFVKMAGAALAGAGLIGISGIVSGCGKEQASALPADKAATAKSAAEAKNISKVYFTRQIDAEHLIRLYEKVNADIHGKVAVKLHTGEPHGPNILPRDMVQAFQAQIPNSTSSKPMSLMAVLVLQRRSIGRHWA